MIADSESHEMLDIRASVALMKTWFAQEFADIHSKPREEIGGILLACPVWGERYVARFSAFCVPSLLAPENAAALADGKSRLVLFSDEAGTFALAAVKRRLEAAGIDVRLHLIPTHISASLGKNPQNKYSMLSVVHNIGVQMAGRLGMGFHMMAGDHVYARDFYPNLKRLGGRYHAIAQSALSADVTKVARDLAKHLDDKDRLVVGGDALNAVGWKHLHKQMQWLTIGRNGRNIKKRLPGHTWLAWRAKDSLVVLSPHMNVTYLSPLMCRMAPTCVPHTLDTALPWFMPAGAYIAKRSDGLNYIELSDHNKPHDDVNRFSTAEWVDLLWGVLRFRAEYLPFMQPCEIGIPRTAKCLSMKEIGRQHGVLMQAAAARHEGAKDDFIEEMLAA